MSEPLMTMLTTVFSEVLADLAFMFSEDAEYEVDPEARWLETSIRYEGPVNGTLRFRCTREFSVVLAASLLGIDPMDENAEEQACDAAKEFMNIVCGQYITRAHGVDDVFNLSIPETTELLEAPSLMVDTNPNVTTIPLEGQYVQVAYELGQEAVACHPEQSA